MVKSLPVLIWSPTIDQSSLAELTRPWIILPQSIKSFVVFVHLRLSHAVECLAALSVVSQS